MEDLLKTVLMTLRFYFRVVDVNDGAYGPVVYVAVEAQSLGRAMLAVRRTVQANVPADAFQVAYAWGEEKDGAFVLRVLLREVAEDDGSCNAYDDGLGPACRRA